MREKTVHKEVVYSGKLIQLEVLDVELEDGTRSKREVIRHPGAVAVVARKADGTFVFVRQYRKPVERYMIEVIAGTRDADEEAEACARREVEEETGYEATSLEPLGEIYPTPGYVDERILVFAADVKPGNGAHTQDHDERVEPVEYSRDEVSELIRGGEILDAKTMAAWSLYLMKKRD